MVASAPGAGWVEAPRSGEGTSAPEVEAERALVERLLRKEAGAFDELVRSHQDRVFDFCTRLMGDREEALDLVQDIFVSVHQHLARFRGGSKLSTWIFRISKNHCLNRLKYLKRRGRGRGGAPEDLSDQTLGDSPAAPVQPDAALALARDKRRVHQAIALLEPEQRVLVALRDIEGLSYEEIIEITELPEGTVKSRLHRARERLGELIEHLEGGPASRGD